jgi:GR25 family glycosyltransferase involved in LPS biosynthesis
MNISYIFYIFLFIIVVNMIIYHKNNSYNSYDSYDYFNYDNYKFNVSEIFAEIPIYWINLDSCNERRELMENQFKKHNLKNIRVSAINGNELKLENYNHNNLRSNELACVLSHIKAIKQAYDDNCKFAVIMEDDANFEYLETYNLYIPLNMLVNKYNYNIVQLSLTLTDTEFENIKKEIYTVSNGNAYSAAAYIINRNGMEQIINSKKKLTPADHWIYQNVSSVGFSNIPYITYNYSNITSSTIGSSNKFADESKKRWDDYFKGAPPPIIINE